jgi:arylsulfatase A-like enzyme
LIVLDSVRRDHLSCYGYERRTTPHIDRLADEGVRFDQAYSNSCWTIPAHASLFTGLYPSRHGAMDLDANRLDEGHLTMASYLAQQGYRTASISCNGLIPGPIDLDRGFQHSVDVGALRGASRGLFPRLVRKVHRLWRERTARDRGTARATKLALRWLNEQEPARPFFLFVNYMDCHLPYRLKDTDRYRFLEGHERERADAVPQDPFGTMAGKVPMSEQQLTDLQALYDGALYHLDWHVGILLHALRSTGTLERTLLIVTSDHGESFGEHGLMDHQYGLYENLIRIPLVIRLPEGELERGVHETPVQLADILPTLANRLGNAGGSLRELDGYPIFEGPSRTAVIAEYPVPNLRTLRRRYPEADLGRLDVGLRSIRVGRYKLIERSDGGMELYDLETDPAEQRNRGNERTDVVTRLHDALEDTLGIFHGQQAKAQDHDDGELNELRDRLRSLGYI